MHCLSVFRNVYGNPLYKPLAIISSLYKWMANIISFGGIALDSLNQGTGFTKNSFPATEERIALKLGKNNNWQLWKNF